MNTGHWMAGCRKLIVFIALLSATATVWAQTPADSTDDMGLDPEGYKVETDFIRHYSHGWFPQASEAHSLLAYSNMFFADVYDFADNLRSRSLRPTTSPFSWHSPYDSFKQRHVLKTAKDNGRGGRVFTNDEESGFPETHYFEYGLSFLLHLPMPAILRLDATLRFMNGILYASDTTRSYLGLSGIKEPLHEVGVAFLEETSIMGSAGFDFPIYGVFLESEVTTISSYYYLHLGATASYALASTGTQYSQIVNAKNSIRYANGSDTVNLAVPDKFAGLNRFRTGIDVGIGWNVAFEFFTFSFEAFCNAPITSVLNDADWKQYTVGLRMGLGFQWLPERK